MAAAHSWTDADDDRLRALAAAGQSVRAIAKALGRSRSSIDRRLRALETGIDRTSTVAATQARIVDGKARRAVLREQLLGDAERMREQLFAPTTVFNFGGKDNTYEEREVERPPFADQLKIAQAVSTLVGTLERLEKLDADSGIVEAVGMLDQIAAAIEAAAGKLGDQEPT